MKATIKNIQRENQSRLVMESRIEGAMIAVGMIVIWIALVGLIL